MNTTTRRILLALGAALLVGGWGTTRYAYTELETMATESLGQAQLWATGLDPYLYPTRNIYIGGIVGMATGAGLIGFGAIATKKDG